MHKTQTNKHKIDKWNTLNTKGDKVARYLWTSYIQFNSSDSSQLKGWIESNRTTHNMHCITQVSRLLFSFQSPM